MKKIIKQVVKFIQMRLMPLFINSNLLISGYYFFIKRSYSLEMSRLFKGIHSFNLKRKQNQLPNAQLRRNIHRLEKGLIMKPRKSIFALEYIQETIDCYEYLYCKNGLTSELEWAKNVLTDYFSVINSNGSDLLTHMLNKFENIGSGAGDMRPYQAKEIINSSLSYEELKEFILTRRSTRWFDGNTVPREKIELAVQVATQAPSACNRQPFQFIVADKKPILAQLSQLPMGTVGFASNIPCMVAVVGDYSNFEFERDRHLIYIDASLSTMQFLLALKTLGVSGCIINWPEIDSLNKEVSSLLSLKPYESVIMLIAIGYAEPTGGIAYSHKKENSELLRFME